MGSNQLGAVLGDRCLRGDGKSEPFLGESCHSEIFRTCGLNEWFSSQTK